MSRTHRSDTAYLPGDHHSGDRGLGFAGSTIPREGTHGPALLYPGLSLPAENDDEFRLVFTSIPIGLTLEDTGEDSSIIAFADSPGTYVGTYDAYKNGALYGSSTWSLSFGDGLTGSLTFDAVLVSGEFTGVGRTIEFGRLVGLTEQGRLVMIISRGAGPDSGLNI